MRRSAYGTIVMAIKQSSPRAKNRPGRVSLFVRIQL
jgi:hypothetical protein